jgi:hypothetical protein
MRKNSLVPGLNVATALDEATVGNEARDRASRLILEFSGVHFGIGVDCQNESASEFKTTAREAPDSSEEPPRWLPHFWEHPCIFRRSL